METEHIVRSFDEDLGQIISLVMEMGGLVETQVVDAAMALASRDTIMAARVVEGDKRIDELEVALDAMAIRTLALRQPMAEDLRVVIASLKIASNLERIGDYAKNIAKRTSIIAQEPSVRSSANMIKRMSVMVQKMITDVLDAFASRDAIAASDVRLRDEEVDEMHNTLFRELLTYMMEDPRNITPCMHLLFVAKNVERMGDHTTSIAEQVYFMVRGEMPEDERPKSDTTSTTFIDPKDLKKTEPESKVKD